MAMKPASYSNIDEYIAGYPSDVQEILQAVRRTIHEAAPEAQEAIKYGIPTFTLNGNLVHFGGYKNHIGFYPAPTGIEQFKDELAVYAQSKGAVQFPLGQPIPYDLIRRITLFRVEDNKKKAATKAKKR